MVHSDLSWADQNSVAEFGWPLDSWFRYAEIAANLTCQEIVDFAMTWNSRRLVIVGIEVNAVFATFAH
jgi:hypothetical protein